MKMDSDAHALVLPSTLLAEVEAVAERTHRPVVDIVREALQNYLHERPDAMSRGRTPAEAADRMRRRRLSNHLPDGLKLRDLMTHGRA